MTTYTFTLREVLAGAVNTPRDTELSITVNEADEEPPSNAMSFGGEPLTFGGEILTFGA